MTALRIWCIACWLIILIVDVDFAITHPYLGGVFR